MANTVIALKKSGTPSSVPSNLANGELAINYADGKLYYKAANGTIASISGNEPNFFGTVNANNTLVVSDTPGDIFTIAAGKNIDIVGDTINDKLTISLTDDVTISGSFRVLGPGNDEGGEIKLANAVTNSVLVGDITVDVYQNKLRFFEAGGTNRGAFINLAATSSSVGTDLLAASSGTDTIARATAGQAFDKANTANITADYAYAQANAAYDAANNAVTDFSPAFNQANIAYAHANAAFDAANNASSNSVQDFNYVYGFAVNAYDQANAAYNAANNAVTDFSPAFIKANLAYAQANAAYDAANNAVTDFSPAFNQANLAYAQANAALPNVSGVTFNGNLTISQNLSADRIVSTHNEFGENFKVGNDAWIGDYNIANTIKIKGQQNNQIGYISFGTADNKALGRSGTENLTYDNNIIWHQGNDGEGSGLNADLLDGEHGSHYAKADDLTAAFTHANIAFNKANTANITADRAWNHANAAYSFANSSHSVANLAFAHANAAFASSNSLNTYTNSTYVKLSAANQTITGDVEIVGTLTLSGNTFFVDATRVQIDDPLLYLAGNNYSSDIVDIGFIANYVNATGQNVHTGLYREHENKEYYLFQGYDKEPMNNHIGALSNNMTLAVLNADIKTSNLILGGANAIVTIGAAFNVANTSGVEAEYAFLRANLAHAHANAAFAVANTSGVEAEYAFLRANLAHAHANAAYDFSNSAHSIANLAFVHANAAFAIANAALPSSSYTAADVLTKIKTVDGASSGLDADLLDGQDGSYYGTAATETAAFLGANLAYAHANSAFDKANSALANVTTRATYSGNLDFTAGGISFGSRVSSATTNVMNHVDLYGTSYGFSITGFNLNAVVPADANLSIFTGATQRARVNSTGMWITGGLNTSSMIKSAGLYDSSNRQLLIKDSTGTVVWGN